MQTSGTSITENVSDHLSVEVRKLIGVQTVRQRFDMEVYSMHQLVKSAQISRGVTTQMQQLAKEIGYDRRQRAERAVRQLDEQLRDGLDRVMESEHGVATIDATDPARAVIPPEVLVVHRLDQVGSSRIADFQRGLEDACGGDPATVAYAISYFHWFQREDPMNVLRRSLLPILVSDFEEFLAGLIRIHSLSSVEQTASMDDALEKAIKKGKATITGNTQKSVDAVAKLIDLKIDILIGEDWQRVCEIFARRNAIIHGDTRVDATYLRRITGQTSTPPSLGSVLVCDEAYSENAIGLLERLADLLAVAFAASLAPGLDELADFTMKPVFRALQAKCWSEAKFMADAVFQDMPDNHQHHELRVNRWMARKMLAGDDLRELDEEIRAWSPPAGTPKFALAKAILLEDENGAVDALKKCRLSVPPMIAELNDWPLIDYMCQRSERFKKEFVLARFGRPIRQSTPNQHRKRQRR
jgi:hypothetical protein